MNKDMFEGFVLLFTERTYWRRHNTNLVARYLFNTEFKLKFTRLFVRGGTMGEAIDFGPIKGIIYKEIPVFLLNGRYGDNSISELFINSF